MSSACDTETCESCGAQTVEGNDQDGRCQTCSGDTSLEHLLRLMSAGVTRDRNSGRFVRAGVARDAFVSIKRV